MLFDIEGDWDRGDSITNWVLDGFFRPANLNVEEITRLAREEQQRRAINPIAAAETLSKTQTHMPTANIEIVTNDKRIDDPELPDFDIESDKETDDTDEEAVLYNPTKPNVEPVTIPVEQLRAQVQHFSLDTPPQSPGTADAADAADAMDTSAVDAVPKANFSKLPCRELIDANWIDNCQQRRDWSKTAFLHQRVIHAIDH